MSDLIALSDQHLLPGGSPRQHIIGTRIQLLAHPYNNCEPREQRARIQLVRKIARHLGVPYLTAHIIFHPAHQPINMPTDLRDLPTEWLKWILECTRLASGNQLKIFATQEEALIERTGDWRGRLAMEDFQRAAEMLSMRFWALEARSNQERSARAINDIEAHGPALAADLMQFPPAQQAAAFPRLETRHNAIPHRLGAQHNMPPHPMPATLEDPLFQQDNRQPQSSPSPTLRPPLSETHTTGSFHFQSTNSFANAETQSIGGNHLAHSQTMAQSVNFGGHMELRSIRY